MPLSEMDYLDFNVFHDLLELGCNNLTAVDLFELSKFDTKIGAAVV